MTAAPALLAGLNDAQRTAVEHDRGPLAVLAGPGTGKTRVLTHRVAHLILERRVEPERILAVTYTVKAANELRERLAELVGPAESQRISAQTFHGLGLGIIRRFADVLGLPGSVRRASDTGAGGILDSAQRKRLLRSILREHRETGGTRLFQSCLPQGEDAVIARICEYFAVFGDRALFPADIAAFITRAESALARGQNARAEPLDSTALAAERERLDLLRDAGRAWELFRDSCRARGLLSFADLILHPIHLLRTAQGPAAILRDQWRHIVVDEFQDVNAAMIELLRLLAPPGPHTDLCVVGDDDQAIYGFRGADDQAFDRFASIWTAAERIDLAHNYRSGPPIISIANSIMSRAVRRFVQGKSIKPRDPEPGDQARPPVAVEAVHLARPADDGPVIAALIRTAREATSSPWSSFAVIVRANRQGAEIHSALALEAIPAHIRQGDDAMENDGVRDALDWARIIADPADAWTVVRLLGRPPLCVPVESILAFHQRWSAENPRARRRAAGEPPPETFLARLARTPDLPPGISRLLELHREFTTLNTQHGACHTLFRIVERINPAGSPLRDPASRNACVAALVRLLRFVRRREARLEAPGDLAAFLAYLDDLDDTERTLADESLEDRIDGPSPQDDDRPDAVRIVTAHSAKGLEFDTVFVPRVSPQSGYPYVRSRDDQPEFPAGLLDHPGKPAADQRSRALAEERRVFYVACTRARRRLVLLAKKNKKPSRSTHFLEELLADTGLGPILCARDASQFLPPPGPSSTPAGDPDDTDLDAEAAAPATPSVSATRAALRAARREALALASSGLTCAQLDGTIQRARAASDAARAGAARLAIISHAESHGAMPPWAAELGDDAAGFSRDLAARLAEAERSLPAPPRLPVPVRPPLRLTHTSIRDYDRCPRCYYVKHILHLVPPSGRQQTVGTIVHKALERYFTLVRSADAGECPHPTRDDLARLARETFTDHSPPSRPLPEAHLDQVLAQLQALPDGFHDPGAHILEIERDIDFPFADHRLSARIDRIDQITLPDGAAGFAIIDYKTGNASDALREPKPDDQQLGLYALALAHAFNLDPASLRGRAEYWCLSAPGGCARGVIALEKLNLDKVRDRVQSVIDGILAGRFNKGSECDETCAVLGAAEPAE